MNKEILIKGLLFVKAYKLTQKENEAFIMLLDKSYSVPELALKLNVNKITLHGIIQRLRLKGLIVLKYRDEKGTNIYEINTMELERFINIPI